jgi:hypothetical protein
VRVPLSKVYRAFREFDGFSDQRCEAYLRLAQSRYKGATVLVSVGSLAAFFLTVWLYFGVGASLLRRLVVGLPGLHPMWSAVYLGCGVLVPALAALLVRDAWVRWVLRQFLRDVRCVRCRYSLLGLQVMGGAVRCPECGERTVLAELGLSEADLGGGAGA